jgi:hypothetical protein
MAEEAIRALESALRSLLGPAFEDDIRSLAENEPWYSPNLSAEELFRFRVLDHIERGSDGLWIFESLRVSERKFLAEKLGIERSSIPGETSAQLADRILMKPGLPQTTLSGPSRIRELWSHLSGLPDAGEDEKAAVLGRQMAERLLRRLFVFYAASLYTDVVLQILADPGSLKLPHRLEAIPDLPVSERANALTSALREEDWADLGFLIVVLRKLSAELERRGEKHLSGEPLTIMSVKEQEAFGNLAKALQAYAHDRPSSIATRRDTLSKALREAFTAIDSMSQRNVIPNELLVLENGKSLLGPVTHGIIEGGRQLRLLTTQQPQLGSRILFIAAAPRDHAKCAWVESP